MIVPLYVTFGLPGEVPTLNAVPVGLVMVDEAEKVKVEKVKVAILNSLARADSVLKVKP